MQVFFYLYRLMRKLRLGEVKHLARDLQFTQQVVMSASCKFFPHTSKSQGCALNLHRITEASPRHRYAELHVGRQRKRKERKRLTPEGDLLLAEVCSEPGEHMQEPLRAGS